MMNFKQAKWRSKKYLDFVRTQPCAICGRPSDHAHHIIGIGGMGGMGTKAPDYMTMPLCVAHHTAMHNSDYPWSDQWEHIARTLGKAIDEGGLDVKS